MASTRQDSPLVTVEKRLADLEAAVDQLPFAGQDQRVRARDGLGAVRRLLNTIQLAEGS